MQNIISFVDSNSDINNSKTDLFICGLFECESFDYRGKIKVSKAVSLESFKGKYRKIVFVYGDNIKRTIVIGLGKKKDYSTLKAREIGATLANYANQFEVNNML